jgi:uncharacterized membrane protein YbhN (UPF0104 family)
MRLGGEPARILGAKHDGVSVRHAVLALALENALTYLILTPAAAIVAARFGKDWWSTVAPHLDLRLVRGLAVTLLVIIAVWVVYALWRRRRSRREHHPTMIGELRRIVADLLSFPLPLLLFCCLLTAISLVARVAILPVLVSSTPEPPSLGVATLASLGLLYGQLAIPTPSGAGPIDVAVLAGAAGVSSMTVDLLAAWRLYTAVLPTAAGLAVGTLFYGRTVFSVLLRRLSRQSTDDVSR